MEYRLHVSVNMGVSYHPLEIAKNPEDLKDMADKLESEHNRWYIDDTEGNIHSYGQYQKSYIDMVLKEKQKNEESGEDYMVTSDDPMVKKVLEAEGVTVLTSNEFISKMTGMSMEEVEAEAAKAPSIENMTREDKERIMATFKDWEERGIIKTHSEEKPNEKTN